MTVIDEVRTGAAQFDPGRALLTVLVAIPYALGWVAGITWTGIAYAITASRFGFRDARQRSKATAEQPPRGADGGGARW